MSINQVEEITKTATEVLTPEDPETLSDDQFNTTPQRGVATVGDPWDSINKEFGLGRHDPEEAKKFSDEQKTKMRDDILAKMVDAQSLPVKGALQFGSLVTTSLEDLYNTGVDIINFADTTFGDGKSLATPSHAMGSLAPQGAGWEISREIGKFAVAYSSALKVVTSLVNPTSKAGIRGAQAISGAMSEFLLAKPELDSITESFVKNVPYIGDDVYAWLNDPEDTGLEARAKAAIIGVAEGEAMEQTFKLIKFTAGLRKAQKSIEDVPAPTVAKEGAEQGAIKSTDPLTAERAIEAPVNINVERVFREIKEIDTPKNLIDASLTSQRQSLTTKIRNMSKDSRGSKALISKEEAQTLIDAVHAKEGEVLSEGRKSFFEGIETVEDFLKVLRPDDARIKIGKGVPADLPPLPPEMNRADLPPIPTEDFIPTSAEIKAAKGVVKRDKLGMGSVNEAGFVDEAGNKFTMNLTKFDTTDDFRKTISNMVDESPEAFGNRKYTNAEISDIAENLDMSIEELTAWTAETGLHLGQIKASSQLMVEAVSAYRVMGRQFIDGELSEEALTLAYSKLTAISGKSQDMKSLAGLLLHEADIAVKPGELSLRQVNEITKVFGDDAVAAARAMYKAELPPGKIAKLMNVLPLRKLADGTTGLRHASNLSSFKTHVRNVVGGFSNTAMRPGETLIAATVNAIQKNPHGVQFSDAHHEMVGMAHGFMDALTITAAKFKGDKTAKFKGVNPKKGKLQYTEVAQDIPDTDMGKAWQFVDKQIIQGSFVADALRFEDNFVKHVNAAMTQRKEAYRMGKFNARKRLDLEIDKLHLGKESIIAGRSQKEVLDEFTVEAISEGMENPTARTIGKMYKDAEYATLTNDISKGTLSRSVSDAATGTALGRLVAPYGKTNLNAMMYKFERIPVINLLLKDARANFNSVDPVVRQQQIGRTAFASTLMTALGVTLHSQDAIMGSGPKDSKKYKMYEQAGYQRDSIRVGDEWVEFQRETPMGGILSLVADLADLTDMVNGDNDQYIHDVHSVAVSMIANIYNPEFLTSNVSKLFKAMADGDVKAAKQLTNATASMFTQFVPYMGLNRDITRAFREGGDIKREAFNPASAMDTFMNRVMSVYAPSSLAVKRNVLGDQMMHKTGLGPDLLSPFGMSKQTDDPVMQELARVSGAEHIVNPKLQIKKESGEVSRFEGKSGFIDIPMPPKVLRVGTGQMAIDTRLSLAEYEQLVIMSSEPTSSGGKDLRGKLSEVFARPSYKSMSLKAQGHMAQKIIAGYHKVGKAKFMRQFIDKKEVKHGLKQVMGTLKRPTIR